MATLGARCHRGNDDLHVVAKHREEAEEASDGEAGQPPAPQSRHLWLINAKDRGRLRLSQPPALDQAVDLKSQFSLDVGPIVFATPRSANTLPELTVQSMSPIIIVLLAMPDAGREWRGPRSIVAG